MDLYIGLMTKLEALLTLQKARFQGSGLTGAQSMMVLRLGYQRLTVGELTLAGVYGGTNACYNLNKLEQRGYIRREQNRKDKRSWFVSLTEKGLVLRKAMLAAAEAIAGAVDQDLAQATMTQADRLIRIEERV